jgi:hypothetical protein
VSPRVAAALLVVALPASPAAASPPLVRYTESGTLLAVENVLTVQPDGRCRLDWAHSGPGPRSGHATFRLAPAALRSLRAALGSARFPTLRRAYERKPPWPDSPNFTVTHGAKRVIVSGGATGPPRLARLIARLGRIVSAHSR